MVDTKSIEEMITPSIEALGYRVVRVAFTGGRRPTLQIMAERLDQAPMPVEDCAAVSHAVSALLDVADPIEAAYQLEVSSPGIDRPLVKREDYERFAGCEAKIELAQPRDGRRRFRGRLLGLDGDAAKLAVGEDELLLLPLAEITRARLVLPDELIAATPPQSRH